MKDYSSKVGAYIRECCLAILLLKGGMHIELKN